MPFNWEEYNQLARNLQNPASHPDEAALRCAVSRAYYALHCQARNFAISRKGFKPNPYGSDHSRVIEAFKTGPYSQVGRVLRELREYRENCDFRDTVANLVILARRAVNEAQRALDILKT